MKAHLDCCQCFLRIGLQAARMAGANADLQKDLMHEFLKELQRSLDTDDPSPLIVANRIQEIVHQRTGNSDPFRDIKAECNLQAQRWLPDLRRQLTQSPCRLETALKIAAIGNIMDYGAFSRFDLESLLKKLKVQDFAVNATEPFRERLQGAGSLTYLADNTGEIVFDSLLIQFLAEAYGLRITLVIRETPFLNDVSDPETLPAELRALDGLEIVPLAVVPAERDPAAWRRIRDSDLVLAKGMANFENFSDEPDFFFLLISKCDLVSRVLSRRSGKPVRTGDWIFMHQHPDSTEDLID